MVWWTLGSGGAVGLVGLVGPWVWWARGSGGHVYLVGPWVWWARGSTLRGLTCQRVLGLVFLAHIIPFYHLSFVVTFLGVTVLFPNTIPP